MRRLCWVGAAVATALCACGAPTPDAPARPPGTPSTTARPVRTSAPDRSPLATTKPPASAHPAHPTTPARTGPFVTLRAGDFPEPRIPALPKTRSRAGATVTVTGKWAARLNLERPTSMVRCSKYSDAAGVQRVDEGATDVHQVGEYGTETGNLYVKVKAGPDGVGKEIAALTLSVADEDLFTGYEATYRSANDSKLRAVYSQGRDKQTVRFAGYVVLGTEFDYSRYADTGLATVTVSFRCPN